MIGSFNTVLGHLFEGALYPFQGLNPWAAIVVLSLITAIIMLLVYRAVSDQNGIRTAKDRIAAHLLEIRLYQNNMPVTFRAQGNILWWNLKYLLHAMRPMLIMIVPLVLVIIHLDMRFGLSPLAPGDSTSINMKLQQGRQPSQVEARIEPSAGIEVETLPLRIDNDRQVIWRLKAKTPGIHSLAIRVNEETVAKKVVVGRTSLDPVPSARVGSRFFDLLLNPGEPPLAESSAVQSIEIVYPPKSLILFGWHIHWLVAFFVLSVLFGFALKDLFKVQI
jgi:hypothetical protein